MKTVFAHCPCAFLLLLDCFGLAKPLWQLCVLCLVYTVRHNTVHQHPVRVMWSKCNSCHDYFHLRLGFPHWIKGFRHPRFQSRLPSTPQPTSSQLHLMAGCIKCWYGSEKGRKVLFSLCCLVFVHIFLTRPRGLLLCCPVWSHQFFFCDQQPTNPGT